MSGINPHRHTHNNKPIEILIGIYPFVRLQFGKPTVVVCQFDTHTQERKCGILFFSSDWSRDIPTTTTTMTITNSRKKTESSSSINKFACFHKAIKVHQIILIKSIVLGVCICTVTFYKCRKIQRQVCVLLLFQFTFFFSPSSESKLFISNLAMKERNVKGVQCHDKRSTAKKGFVSISQSVKGKSSISYLLSYIF